MTDAARRAYLALGRGFVLVGVVIAALAIADAVAGLGFFRGSPLGTAVFLALVGGLLLWTVRQADAQRARRRRRRADGRNDGGGTARRPRTAARDRGRRAPQGLPRAREGGRAARLDPRLRRPHVPRRRRGRRRDLPRRARRGRRLPGPERGGQDHDAQGPLRAAAPQRRVASGWPASSRAAANAPSCAASRWSWGRSSSSRGTSPPSTRSWSTRRSTRSPTPCTASGSGSSPRCSRSTGLLRKQVRKLSLGERMKCELAAALLHRPKVLFLDEPTIGLDVTMQQQVRRFVADYNARHGATVVLTSHYMADVTALARRILVIDHGRLVFDGDLHALVEARAPERRVRLTLSEAADLAALTGLGTVRRSEGLVVELGVPRAEVARVVAVALARLPVVDVAIEDVRDRGHRRRPVRGGRRRRRGAVVGGPRMIALGWNLRKAQALFAHAFATMTEYRAEIVHLDDLRVAAARDDGGVDGAGRGRTGRRVRARVDFAAYFLAVFLVRQLTVVWVVWELDREIRLGELSPKLLRPFDPMWVHLGGQRRREGGAAAARAGAGRRRHGVGRRAGADDARGARRVRAAGRRGVGDQVLPAVRHRPPHVLDRSVGRARARLVLGLDGAVGGVGAARPVPGGAARGLALHPVPVPDRRAGPGAAWGGSAGADLALAFAVQAAWGAFFVLARWVLWRQGLRRYGAVGA